MGYVSKVLLILLTGVNKWWHGILQHRTKKNISVCENHVIQCSGILILEHKI